MNKLKVILQCILGSAPLIFSIALPIELLWESLDLVLDLDSKKYMFMNKVLTINLKNHIGFNEARIYIDDGFLSI